MVSENRFRGVRASRLPDQDLLLRLEDVSKSYSGTRILDSVHLSLYAGESVAVIGPNGSGKSTLLRVICGLTTIDSGKRALSIDLRDVGYVPDRFPILRFTPREYLMAMGRLQGLTKSMLDLRIYELLHLFSLEAASDERMTGFSKGMLQKVNLMQGVLKEPALLALDEPLSGLDQDSQQELVAQLVALKGRGTTLVIVSHALSLAAAVADRVVRVDAGRVSEDVGLKPPKRTSVVQVQFRDNRDKHELERHPGVMHIDVAGDLCTLYVDASITNDVLRVLLQMDADIRSLNQLE